MITILWTLFEIAINIYQGAMATYFVYTFLGSKRNSILTRWATLVFILIYSLAICIENYLIGHLKYYYAIVYIVLLVIYSSLILKGTIAKKLFAAVMSNVIILISSALWGNMAAVIFDEKLEFLMTTPSPERFMTIVTVQLWIFYVMFISLRLFNKFDKKDDNSVFQWSIVSVMLIISIIIGAYINYAVIGNSERIGLFSIFIFMCVVLMNILVCYLLTDLLKKNRAVNEVNLLKQTQDYNRQYIENMKTEYETVKKIRHDYKNSFLALSALLENGEIEKAIEQIDKNIGAMSETEIFVDTNNTVVNAVINAKLSAAKSLGVECECLVAGDVSDIDDIDICRLLSNMLDNSITACQAEQNLKKSISLSIRGDSSSYIFTVKNTISESVLEKNPQLISTKDNQNEHGYGVKIIREIAKTYSGRSDFYEEDGMFCCSVYLRRRK